MKLCLRCRTSYDYVLEGCPSCGLRPDMVNGFTAYAPELAHTGCGFEPDYFPKLAKLEEGSFWFRARNSLILWALGKYCGNFCNYLEIGCGTGYVLKGVAHHFPLANLTASEIFTAGLHFAARRVRSARLMQMDARRIPFVDEFDVVGAFDVLEHIREDVAVLKELSRALKPRGHLVLTVPQHSWLWSPADVYSRHERRYSAKDIHQKLRDSGFAVRRSTSFVSLLLPLMLISRRRTAKKSADFDPEDEFRLSTTLNDIFHGAMSLERFLIQTGLNLPAGGSRLIVAQRIE